MEFNICRACLGRTATISVFEGEGVQYCVKMMKCANIVIAEGDGLPEVICEGCAADLAVCYEFASRCEASDRALRSLQSHETPAHDTNHEPLAPCVKIEIKPENDPADGLGFFETSFDDCFEFKLTNEADEIKYYTKEKKSKIHPIENEKWKSEYSKKVLPKHLRKRNIRLKTGPIKCMLCEKTLPCHSAFQVHMRSHTKEKPYQCDICKKSYSTKHILKTHILGHYGLKESSKAKSSDKRCNRPKREPYQCTTCGRMATCRSAMEDHLRTHTGEKPFACELCGNKYRLKGTLQRHMHTQHPENHPGAQYICEHCGKVFHARTNIITHMRVHTGAKPYQCPLCPERFRQISSMIRHKRLHTGEKPFSCKICERKFSDFSALRRHQSVHSSERTFNCHICTKRFKRREGLRAHVARHSKEKPWVCSYCGLRVTTKSNLKIHTERMHSERSGTCTVCSKQVSDVAAHMRAHTGERPFRCGQCARSYGTQRSLSHHVGFKHRDADKFKCALDHCTRSFPTASMLEFHVLKTHTQSAPHVCAQCARGFLRACDLSRHRRQGHGERAPCRPDAP